MCAVSKNEKTHRRERHGRAEGIGNLCGGRYLPVEVMVVKSDGKDIRLGLLMEIHLHNNILISQLEFGTLEPEVLANCGSRGTKK